MIDGNEDLSTLYTRLTVINENLEQLFPTGNNPFQIMTRLLEECGELAQQVNHFEGQGVKNQKHGNPNRARLAKEVQDVLRCTLQIVHYYHIEADLARSIDASYQKVISHLETDS